MKKIALILACAAIALPASAQQQPLPPAAQQQIQQMQNMSPAEQAEMMQKLMQSASTLQLCMNEIGGEAGIKDLQQRGEAVQQRVQQLCRSGEFDEAQALALSEGRAIASDPRIVKLKSCASSVLDAIPQLKELSNPDIALSKHHVCNQSNPNAAVVQ